MTDLQNTRWYQKKLLFGVPAGGFIIGAMLQVLMQCIFYNIGGWYARLPGQTIHILKWGIDDAIPMVQIFILPYIASYVVWLIGLIAPSKNDKDFYFDWVIGCVIALTLGLIVFFAYPTYMYRDQEHLFELAGDGVFGTLIKTIYSLDGGDLAACLFPSYHCTTSMLCLLGVWRRKEISKGFRIFTVIISVLIFMSTVFVKQHYLPDVVCGIFFAALGFWVARKFHLGKGLAALWMGKKN